MSEQIVIPSEAMARAECNILFGSLIQGDFAGALRAQERLRQMGWYVSREAPKPPRRRKPRQAAEQS
jgi:hypothetical protein